VTLELAEGRVPRIAADVKVLAGGAESVCWR